MSRAYLAFDGEAAPRLVDQVVALLEPDRHARPNPEDECPGDPALRLGQRTVPRIEGVPTVTDAAPPKREVPVEVHAARVLARAGGHAVGMLDRL